MLLPEENTHIQLNHASLLILRKPPHHTTQVCAVHTEEGVHMRGDALHGLVEDRG